MACEEILLFGVYGVHSHEFFQAMFNVNVTVTGWALESVAKSNNIFRTFGNVD